MRTTGRFGLVVALGLLLAACFLVPGKFTSTLDVRRDGRFDFAYKGEIVLLNPAGMGRAGQLPDGFKPDPSQPCYGPPPRDRAKVMPVPMPLSPAVPPQLTPPPLDVNSRKCTAAEVAERNANWAKSAAEDKARKKAEGERLAQLIGFDPSDEASMNRFAAQMTKQSGWRSVVYKGNGVFDVDFAQSGTLDRDFIFPLFPKGNVLVPFVIIRKRVDGAVAVSAPGFAGGVSLAMMQGIVGGGPADRGGLPDSGGTFTITSDTRPLTNNTDDGPADAAGRSVLGWTIGRDNQKVPEALLPLPR